MIDTSLSIHLKCIGGIVVWTQQSSLHRKYDPFHGPITLIVYTFFFHTLDPSETLNLSCNTLQKHWAIYKERL